MDNLGFAMPTDQGRHRKFSVSNPTKPQAPNPGPFARPLVGLCGSLTFLDGAELIETLSFEIKHQSP